MSSQKKRVLFVLAVIFLGVFFSLGQVRFALNSLTRSIILHQYLSSLSNEKQIDPEQFWEFRDFYGATTSTFTPSAIKNGTPFLSFSTPYMKSNDYLLAERPQLKDVKGSDIRILLKNESELVYSDAKKLYIQFIKPQSEMQKANGFFTYFDTDLTQYVDSVWYNKTEISL